MWRNLSPALRQQLENLDKDPDSRRSAMKALRTYVKDMDAKSIPAFLTQVSETKEPGSSGEFTISLYEVLVRVHGRNIVPQIDSIMATIIRTLSSSSAYFPLHQACSKVVPAIARYGIDPLTPDEERSRVIGSLCKPLSDLLMNSQEGTASGAALCLKALVESDNWRFASQEMVNDVCLKVAGSLEEKSTQTNSHMGLAMSLLKQNQLVAEAYARSLVRSCLQILNAEVKESKSQKRLSAIQMINFLMKCVDTRSISSEFAGVIGTMERCLSDQMPFVRGAAFEALQTAKTLAGHIGYSKRGSSCSPVVASNFDGENSMQKRRVLSDFPSPESQTVDSFMRYDSFVDSPLSIGQSSCNRERTRCTNRKLWNSDIGGVDISLKDGLLKIKGSDEDVLKVYSDKFTNDDPSEPENIDSFTGFMQNTPMVSRRKDSTSSPQKSGVQVTIDDVRIYSTPRRLMRSLQNSNSNHIEVGEWETTSDINDDLHSQISNCEPKINSGEEIPNNLIKSEEIFLRSNVVGSISPSSVQASARKADYGTESAIDIKNMKFLKVLFLLVCGVSIALAIALGYMQVVEEEASFYLVPT